VWIPKRYNDGTKHASRRLRRQSPALRDAKQFSVRRRMRLAILGISPERCGDPVRESLPGNIIPHAAKSGVARLLNNYSLPNHGDVFPPMQIIDDKCTPPISTVHIRIDRIINRSSRSIPWSWKNVNTTSPMPSFQATPITNKSQRPRLPNYSFTPTCLTKLLCERTTSLK